MPDLESIIPIVRGDLASRPIGIVKFEDGIIKFKLNDKAQLPAENPGKGFAPVYIVTKEENGLVKELELLALRLVDVP